jgi:hypothetical protein
MVMTPPIPFFGSKRQAAEVVWQHLGDPAVYLEPFAGSLAVLLARPHEPAAEIACDLDGLIVNFWRALKHDPAAVLAYDMGPIAEDDVEAYHRNLVDRAAGLSIALRGGGEYYNARLAYEWWAGISSWLGSGWCTRNPPSRQRPHIDRTLKGLYAVGCTDERILELSRRLANVVLLSGDWENAWQRVVSDSILNRFRRDRGGVGVFLDPPYTHTTGRAAGLYAADASLSAEVQDWAVEHACPVVRIVVAGYEDEYPTLAETWGVVRWSTPSGYVNTSGNERRKADVLFLSPF